jgi:hypothetical protein
LREFVFAIIAILIGTLIPLGVAEIVFRWTPTNEGAFVQPVNSENPTFHFEPNREFTWSRGWNFSIVNQIRINNVGFVNDQNYRVDDPRPLLAIIGDSYVEAFMVPTHETLHARLEKTASPDARVYSFAASGAPLSQYLAWASDARKKWKAQALVIIVVGNDFDESLLRYKSGPGFHHYIQNPDGTLTLTRIDYQPALVRKIVKHSYLARYLLYNVEAHHHVRWLIELLPEFIRPVRADTFVGNTSTHASPERLELSKAAVRAFLRDLVTYANWKPNHVLFALDGARYPSEASALAASYFGEMRAFFIAEARKLGFEVLDLDQKFFAHHNGLPMQFSFPTDGHWNGFAHGIVAGAIAETTVFKQWRAGAFSTPKDTGGPEHTKIESQNSAN